MIAKTTCQQCGQHIEFEAEGAGQYIPCPNCAQETLLLLPSAPAPGSPASNRFMLHCPDCAGPISRKYLFCPHCGSYERRLFPNLCKIVFTIWGIHLLVALIIAASLLFLTALLSSFK